MLAIDAISIVEIVLDIVVMIDLYRRRDVVIVLMLLVFARRCLPWRMFMYVVVLVRVLCIAIIHDCCLQYFWFQCLCCIMKHE